MEIAPMLATTAEPFDSAEHLFEIKWDGVRGLAAIEHHGWRLWGRGVESYTARYPELEVLRQFLPATILDGELVRLTDQGRADFTAMQRRHPLTSPRKIRWAAQQAPVTYVVFDLLQLRGRCLLHEPLELRRQRLAEVWPSACSRLQLAEAVIGAGKSYFRHAISRGHEGVMAKRLDSRYQPGKRSPAWRKIKPQQEVVCVVCGYRLRRDGTLLALLLAARCGRELRYVGQVRDVKLAAASDGLAAHLAQRRCAAPFVPCAQSAHWVSPEFYCRVRCFGWTSAGRLRFPYFVSLLDCDHGASIHAT